MFLRCSKSGKESDIAADTRGDSLEVGLDNKLI